MQRCLLLLVILALMESREGISPQQITLITLRPRQNGRHLPDDIFKCIFLNGNLRFFIKISLKFVPKGPINNIPALVQTMAWRQLGDKAVLNR